MPEQRSSAAPVSIALERVCVRVAKQTLVGPVSLRAEAGQLTCLLGPNGSGKTSLLRAIAGLHAYDGTISVGGQDAHSFDAQTRARKIAFVPQRSLLDAPLQVRSVVAQGRYSFSERGAKQEEVERALHAVGLQDFAERIFPRLSLGEQRRVLIARALASSASVLLLDEPDAYLDVRERLRLFALLTTLRDAGHTLLVVVHALDAALRHADQCALLDHGKLVSTGKPDDALSAAHLQQVFGIELVASGAPLFRLPEAGRS